MINLLYYEYWTDKQKYLYVYLFQLFVFVERQSQKRKFEEQVEDLYKFLAPEELEVNFWEMFSGARVLICHQNVVTWDWSVQVKNI